ncbi:hypothetical protein [Burkholderia gladioli]|uniref:hypothetical protein n=1 Tax=Burkholderia gladioli TaxID=28095 RepID=UPI001C5F21DB|nr:hypothetical protein [Burkholderia gladioli]MBW5288110.1 hypothetical protein [Burkholderia gladioli]
MKKYYAAALASGFLMGGGHASAAPAAGIGDQFPAASGTFGNAPVEIRTVDDIVAQLKGPDGFLMATMAAGLLICGKGASADPEALRRTSTAYDFFLGLAVEEGRMDASPSDLRAKAARALSAASCDRNGVPQL